MGARGRDQHRLTGGGLGDLQRARRPSGDAAGRVLDDRGPAREAQVRDLLLAGADNEHTRSYLHFIEDMYAHLKGGHRYPDEVEAQVQSFGAQLL